jgi:hypothetical protein
MREWEACTCRSTSSRPFSSSAPPPSLWGEGTLAFEYAGASPIRSNARRGLYLAWSLTIKNSRFAPLSENVIDQPRGRTMTFNVACWPCATLSRAFSKAGISFAGSSTFAP